MDKEKGLLNNPGEYNCFVNTVIQALFHLNSFGTRFMCLLKEPRLEHSCSKEACIFCSLKHIFEDKQSDDEVLLPHLLRRALAVGYVAKDRFQLREIDDATEALEGILSILKKNLQGSGPQEALVDDIFRISTAQSVRCPDCLTETPSIHSESFVHYTYTFSLRALLCEDDSVSFGDLLSRAMREDQRRCTNEECRKMCTPQFVIESFPEVFTLGMVWADPGGAPLPHIDQILRSISLDLDLSQVFRTQAEEPETNQKQQYAFRGMICYYGQHYNAYFYSDLFSKWFVFDDVTVKPVGTEWASVVERALKGHLQPSVLFYERTGREAVKDAPESVPDRLSLERSLFDVDFEIAIKEETHSSTPAVTSDKCPTTTPAPDPSVAYGEEEDHCEQDKVDIPVYRINWLYQKNKRIFRIAKDGFARVMPDGHTVKCTFDYKDVAQIEGNSTTSVIIKFTSQSGCEHQYIQTEPEHIQRLVKRIVFWAEKQGHSIPLAGKLAGMEEHKS